MSVRLAGLVIGIAAGFVASWARMSDPLIIRAMLLLRDPYVFLVMGSAIAVAAVGIRALKALNARALLTGEPISWSVDRPCLRHIGGAALFGVGWSVAGTCPGPLAVMVGEGKFGGLAIVAGLMAGVTLQRAWTRKRAAKAAPIPAPVIL